MGVAVGISLPLSMEADILHYFTSTSTYWWPFFDLPHTITLMSESIHTSPVVLLDPKMGVAVRSLATTCSIHKIQFTSGPAAVILNSCGRCL